MFSAIWQAVSKLPFTRIKISSPPQRHTFPLVSTWFCIILAIRDPFRLYTNDTILKLAKPEEKQEAISYVQFARKLGTTSCSLLSSALLLKLEIIDVIIVVGFLSIIEVFIGMRLYSMLNIRYNNNEAKINSIEQGEKINDNIYN